MNMITAMQEAGFNVRQISDAEYKRLCLKYPHTRVQTVRIPDRRPSRRDVVLPVSAVYASDSIRDANGEPWKVAVDTTGQATFVALG